MIEASHIRSDILINKINIELTLVVKACIYENVPNDDVLCFLCKTF